MGGVSDGSFTLVVGNRWAYASLVGKKEKTRRGNHRNCMCKLQRQTVLFTPHQNIRPCESLQPWHHLSRPSHEKSRRHHWISHKPILEKRTL